MKSKMEITECIAALEADIEVSSMAGELVVAKYMKATIEALRWAICERSMADDAIAISLSRYRSEKSRMN